jgi:type II secretory pathway pseudopilin PulG
LVVISVLAVLVALLLPNLIGVRLRARDAARKQDLAQIKTALRMYYNDYQYYPNHNDGKIAGCGETADADCPNANGSFAVGEAVYLRHLPDFTTDEIVYQQLDSGEGFILSIRLENPSDSQIVETAARCGVAEANQNYYLCAD